MNNKVQPMFVPCAISTKRETLIKILSESHVLGTTGLEVSN